MSKYSIQLMPDQEILQVKIQGEFDAQLLNTVATKFKKELSRHNCNLVLIDHREAWPNISTLNLYDRPKEVLSRGVDRSIRVAIIYSSRKDDYRFVENVAQNQGFNWRVFKDFEKGLKWLKS